jgi:hypothetical protein
LDKLFDGIAAQPSAPEYWWVYALLLSALVLTNGDTGAVSRAVKAGLYWQF